MKISDSFNSQFKLYNYLHNLNNDLIIYLENNNININYYCFFSTIIDNKHKIITSDTTKRKDNGHRLITITTFTTIADKNYIYDNGVNTLICFEDIYIKITAIIDNLNNKIDKLNLKIILKPFYSQIRKECVNYCFNINKNVQENDITIVYYPHNITLLRELPNLQELTFSNTFNQIIGENILPNSLQTIDFGQRYNQVININTLPSSLKTITLSCYYFEPLAYEAIPSSLQAIIFNFHNIQQLKSKKHIIPKQYHDIIKYINYA
jgi:hypothetical protein